MAKVLFKLASFWTLILLCASISYGAIEPVNNRIQGDALADLIGGPGTLDIADNKFYMIQNGLYVGLFENKNVRNTITFGIDESDMTYQSAEFAYRITFDIAYTRLIDGVLMQSEMNGIQLDVNFDPARGTMYKDRGVFTFDGGLDVKVEVTQIEELIGSTWTALGTNALRSSIFLESEIVTERYYSFDQSYVPPATINVDNTTVPGELIISWPYIEGAEDYELEWAWVNAYTGNTTLAGVPVVETNLSLLNYNFTDNATRVRLEGQNSYSIPLIYGDGYMVFRYRGVGRGGSTFNIPLEGTWSSAGTSGGADGPLAAYPNYVSVSAHEGNGINYGAGMSFIENGVRSTGVTYMDGVLKPRQSQAQLNSQDKIIVGSTIYDHYGRPAIGVMSTPVDQNTLGYVENLNMHSDGTPYNKNHFDLDASTADAVGCGQFLAADPMDATTSLGAAGYYSETNTDQEGFNAYLPDAEGYPFVQVHYDNDPTGRIKRVGGVGQDHQIGETTIGTETHDAHYTEYFYTTPEKNELYTLFGNDAIKGSNYTKVITKDVHGQQSVAIIDPMGRTVVTYMQGEAPAGLSAIEGNDGDDPIVDDLMEYNDVNEIDGILRIDHSLFIDKENKPYTFNYDFTAVSYLDECIPESLDVCFDCVYEVVITITPDQFNPNIPDCRITDGTNPLGSATTGIVTMTYTVGSITEFNTACEESPLTFSGVNPGDETFTLYFPKVGDYWITKELRVSQAPLDYYWQEYQNNSTCLITESEFLNDAISNIDPTDCEEMTPCEFNFLLEYGTEEMFIANGGTAAEYATTHEEYLETCGALNPCEMLLPMMLADLSAGGQYGAPAISGTSADDLATSIFSGSALYPSGLNFHNYGPFYDDDGAVSYLDLDGNGSEETPAHSVTVSSIEFYNHWQDSWSINFLELHPEYCYYQFCNDFSEFFDYEQDLNSAMTFDEACAAGLLNYLPQMPSWMTISGYPVYPASCTPTTSGVSYNMDPIFTEFTASTSSSTFYTDMMNLWTVAYTDGTNSWDIYEFAVLLCGEDPSSVNFGEGCNKDKHWLAFKSLYMSKRFQVIDMLRNQYVLDNCPYAACVGSVGDPDCTLDPNPFENKIPHHISYEENFFDMTNVGSINWTTLANDNETEIENQCLDQCTYMADTWMDQLAGCDDLLPGTETWIPGQATYDAIEAELIEVCAGGCGPSWPFLAQNNPAGTSTGPVYNSFQNVLIDYFTTETVGCNHLLITHPAPATGTESIVNTLDACACNALLDVNATTIEEFTAIYGFSPSDYTAEKCMCESYEDEFIAEGNWSDLEAAQIPTANNYLCTSTCLTCELLTATDGLIDQFEDEFLVTYSTEPTLFTAFVNGQSEFAYSYEEITELIENCNLLDDAGTTPIYNLLNPEVNQFTDLLEALAQNNLAVTTNNYNHLTLDEYFYGGLYPCTDPTTDLYDYIPNLVGNNITFNIDNLTCSGNCAVSLQLISTLPSAFANAAQMYDAITSFGNPYILLSDYLGLSTLSPDLHDFYVTASANLPGGGTTSLIFKVSSPCHSFVEYYEDPVSRDPSFRICGGEFVPQEGNPCMQELIASAEMTAHTNYLEYLSVQEEIFKTNYIKQCSQVNETFEVEFESNRYHYTLLYYDLSGNLTKTVPPMGVDKLSSIELSMLHAFITNPTIQPVPQYPNHQFVTTYKHNALNQIVEVNTPDGGTSYFWYDEIGRPVVSQNAKQADFNTTILDGDPTGSGVDIPAYSYMRYDNLGRVYEAGEVIHSTPMTNAISKDYQDLEDWLDATSVLVSGSPVSVVRNNVTQIFYDEKFSTDAETTFGDLGYGETRNRVTATSVISGYVTNTGTWLYPDPDYVNHYQYDVHGNVSAFLQEIDALDTYDNRYRRVDYDYDLISGNSNYIYYQKGKPDQYIHHYRYDADNRLAEVFTSDDGLIWDRDADYEYREDGYLARTELGEMKVQGMDYAYTLHGWIKSLNSGVLDADNDMGRDGEPSPSAEYDSYENDIHGLVARDALAYTVGYYDGDYKAISRNQTGYTNMQAGVSPTAGFALDKTNLFNGNITSLITNMTDFDGNKLDVLANAYHYDQLHRFELMHVFSTTASDAITNNAVDNATRKNVGLDVAGMGDYEMAVSYDQNGNITDLTRMAYGNVSNKMDQFTYHNKREDGTTTYNASAGNPIDFTNLSAQGYTNRLDYVDDAAGNTSSYDDIEDNQALNNYTYHADGSLKSDLDEHIAYIDWYPGKVLKRVYRDGTTNDPDLYFEYDPMGRRSLKVEVTRDNTNAIEASNLWKYTYYAYDVKGTNLAVYKLDQEPTVDELKRIETVIYGGSRLGAQMEVVNVIPRENPSGCGEGCLQTVVIQISNPLPVGDPDILVKLNGTPIHTAVQYTSDYAQTAQNLANAIAFANPDLFVYVTNPGMGVFQVVIEEKIAGELCGDLTLTLDGADATENHLFRQLVTKCKEERVLGQKVYEIVNYLGNVNEVVSDRKIQHQNIATPAEVDYYEADVITYSDYYPYGMEMPGRMGSRPTVEDMYRFGYHGMEFDHEMAHNRNSYTTQFRQYDPRLGRWKSLDPLAGKYPDMSPFAAFNNNPIYFVDPLGLEGGPADADFKYVMHSSEHDDKRVAEGDMLKQLGDMDDNATVTFYWDMYSDDPKADYSIVTYTYDKETGTWHGQNEEHMPVMGFVVTTPVKYVSILKTKNPLKDPGELITEPLGDVVTGTVMVSNNIGGITNTDPLSIKGSPTSFYAQTSSGSLPIYKNGNIYSPNKVMHGPTQSQLNKAFNYQKFNNTLGTVTKPLGWIEYGAIAYDVGAAGYDMIINGVNDANTDAMIDAGKDLVITAFENIVIDSFLMSGNPALMAIGGIYYVFKFFANLPPGGVSIPDPRDDRGFGQDTTSPDNIQGLPDILQGY